MTRRQYIEQIRRMIYGGQPSDDAEITVSLVNQWLNQAVAHAARQNYVENFKLEGVAYINNGFYSTFSNLSVTKDSNFLWRVQLPNVPTGVGTSGGVSSFEFVDNEGKVSYPVVMMSQSQRSVHRGMREIPNRLVGYQEGKSVYVLSAIRLSQYTAKCTMVSGGGDSTDLNSSLNVPADFLPVVTEYLKNQLMFSRQMPVDEKHDGIDSIKNV